MKELDQGSAGIRQYPVGSVCVVVKTLRRHEMLGEEVTIIGPLEARISPCGDIWLGYETDKVCADGLQYATKHEYLKLKRLPGQLDEWATEKVKSLFNMSNNFVEAV